MFRHVNREEEVNLRVLSFTIASFWFLAHNIIVSTCENIHASWSWAPYLVLYGFVHIFLCKWLDDEKFRILKVFWAVFNTQIVINAQIWKLLRHLSAHIISHDISLKLIWDIGREISFQIQITGRLSLLLERPWGLSHLKAELVRAKWLQVIENILARNWIRPLQGSTSLSL